MKIWIAGFGNPDRQDDGAGVELASRVAEWLGGIDGIETELCLEHQLLPELAEELFDVDLAVFADADMRGYEAGWSIEEVRPSARVEGLNIHSMGPGWLLQLAGQLGASPKRAVALSVSGCSFDFSDRLTPECERRVLAAESGFKEWFAAVLAERR